ncbi:MAG: Maf family protein [Peptostreptococcus sp.]|uniref:Maf family protein n=1 Tax=Peptostreptococcus sp. TaxID=1262 RepID=UPI002FC91DEB
MNIILASKSPRRKELLEMCNISFKTVVSNIDEKEIENQILKEKKECDIYTQADTLTASLAYNKAKSVSLTNPNHIVIGSDTVVASDLKILGKPSSEVDAYQTLIQLCGNVHRVYTGVSLFIDGREEFTFTNYTEVEFFKYDDCMENIIRDYIKTGSPMDKAGAYGIQDMGSLLIKEIKGDYYTVMGLPISSLYRKLLPYI